MVFLNCLGVSEEPPKPVILTTGCKSALHSSAELPSNIRKYRVSAERRVGGKIGGRERACGLNLFWSLPSSLFQFVFSYLTVMTGVVLFSPRITANHTTMLHLWHQKPTESEARELSPSCQRAISSLFYSCCMDTSPWLAKLVLLWSTVAQSQIISYSLPIKCTVG